MEFNHEIAFNLESNRLFLLLDTHLFTFVQYMFICLYGKWL